MSTRLAKYLGPLTLLEWGGILLYFSLSGRIAAFLHPLFRPLVLVAGILLAITALILLLSVRRGGGHDHGEEVSCGHDHGDGHVHAHEQSAWRSVASFLVLLLPIALAAGYSPDSYGANMVRNRGLTSSAAALPGAKAQPTPVQHAGVDNATAAVAPGDPPLPTADGEPQASPATASADSSAYENPALKPNAAGNIPAEVIDLLYATEEPTMRKDFDGKRVEMIGQVVHRNEAEHEKGSFQLVRFLMVCCAADVRPVAVLIDYPKEDQDFKSMSWVKVVGQVQFRKAGSGSYPVVVPASVKPTDEPADQYLY